MPDSSESKSDVRLKDKVKEEFNIENLSCDSEYAENHSDPATIVSIAWESYCS